MKMISGRKIFSTVLAFVALIASTAGFADGPYSGSLGAGTVNYSPTDVWRLICPAGTGFVLARTVNPNGNPVDEIATTIHAVTVNGRARTVISLEGVAPPSAVLTGGAGVYFVSVHKDSSLVSARYTLTLDCYRSTGAAFAGTQTLLIQNQ